MCDAAQRLKIKFLKDSFVKVTDKEYAAIKAGKKALPTFKKPVSPGTTAKTIVTTTSTATSKKKVDSDTDSAEDDDEEKKKKAAVDAKKPGAKGAKQQTCVE